MKGLCWEHAVPSPAAVLSLLGPPFWPAGLDIAVWQSAAAGGPSIAVAASFHSHSSEEKEQRHVIGKASWSNGQSGVSPALTLMSWFCSCWILSICTADWSLSLTNLNFREAERKSRKSSSNVYPAFFVLSKYCPCFLQQASCLYSGTLRKKINLLFY